MLIPVVAAMGLVPLVAGCSTNNAAVLAADACAHVRASISELENAEHTTDHATANALAAKALSQLRMALPDAAEANSQNPYWQPLMTTISESSRVPEIHLIVALNTQCVGVGTATAGN